MSQLHLLPAILLSPFVGALLLLFVPDRRRNLTRAIALLAAAVSLLLTVAALFLYDRGSGGMQFVERLDWVPSFGIHLDLGVDGLSLPLVLLTAIILFAGVFVTWKLETRSKEFFIYTLVLVGGVFGVFMATDLLVLFMFIEVAVIPKYVLISVWGSTRKEYAAMKYTMYLLSGSAIALVAILAIFAYAHDPVQGLGVWTFDLKALATIHFDPNFQKFAFFLMLAGFGVLVPLFPLHRWTPDGHSAAPTAISMLLAGVIMKLGGYALIRVGIGLFPQGAAFWAPVIAILAAINAVYIAFVAMVQKDLKFVVANSSISHMGFVLIGIASLNAASIDGAVAQMFAHGIMAALFFAIVGLVYDKAHTRIIDDFGGLAHQMPRVAAAFLLVGLASLGLPGMFNFVAEFTVFTGAIQVFPVQSVIAIFSVVVTAIYVLWVFQRIFFGPRLAKWDHLKDARGVEMIPIVLLVAVLIGFGIYPRAIMDMVTGGVVPIAQRLAALQVGGAF
ncbi:MAG TPA: NADH-quinone oxidoreductase subunit M [Rectinemataceae bacterium]|nr:NADH-quinone oxidoreductase subunit M [Rectinemataceae bacterium]